MDPKYKAMEDAIGTADPELVLALTGLFILFNGFAVVMWIISSFVCASAARKKGYSGFGFFCLSTFATPLIGFLAVIAFPRKFKAVEVEEIEYLIEEDDVNGTIPDAPSDFKM